MFAKPHREVRGRLHGAYGRPHTRRRILALVSATMVAVLAALPTAASLASASGAPPGGAGEAQRPGLPVPQLVAPGELLSTGELQRLLSQLPLDDLSAAQLAHYLTTLEGVSALAELKLGLITPELLGATGLEESLREAIEQLGAGAKLGELAGAEGVAQLLPNLEEALESKLSLLGLPLGLSLHGLLEQLLGNLNIGGGLTGLEGAEGALGSLSLEQLVSSLLGTAKAEELPLQEQLLAKLATLTGALFGELGSEGTLETLLGGSQLSGEFVPTSVEQVAEQLHTSSEAVSQQLGQTTEQLPETATMLTAPLSNGELLGVAPAVKGLVTGLLGNLPGGGETPGGGGSGEGSGEGKGSGESTGTGTGEGGKGSGAGGSGGQGGPGGTGAGGTAGSTTVLVTLPSSPAQAPATGPAKVGKVSVVAHHVHGHVATILLRVPAAGTASIHGKGVRTASKQAAKAERLTLKVSLSKALAASLRHHHHGRAVRLTVAFHPTTGTGSSTALTVRFK